MYKTTSTEAKGSPSFLECSAFTSEEEVGEGGVNTWDNGLIVGPIDTVSCLSFAQAKGRLTRLVEMLVEVINRDRGGRGGDMGPVFVRPWGVAKGD